jgi:hypothetical protein
LRACRERQQRRHQGYQECSHDLSACPESIRPCTAPVNGCGERVRQNSEPWPVSFTRRDFGRGFEIGSDTDGGRPVATCASAAAAASAL